MPAAAGGVPLPPGPAAGGVGTGLRAGAALPPAAGRGAGPALVSVLPFRALRGSQCLTAGAAAGALLSAPLTAPTGTGAPPVSLSRAGTALEIALCRVKGRVACFCFYSCFYYYFLNKLWFWCLYVVG